MPYGSSYTLTVAGKSVTAANPDYFLRRRNGAEILASGMSDGCGDNAIAAYYLFQKRGLETLFIDSAQISTESLEHNFSGHAVVAVHDPKTDVWVFVDPTKPRFSLPWNTGDKTFYGNYWIGFRGRLEDYPAHDPDSLKKFYRDTLNTIPKEVLDQKLVSFRFTVDPSMIRPGGLYRNPNLGRFLADNGKILAAHGVHPLNAVAVRLMNGEDSADSRCEFSKDSASWTCAIGQRSALSLGFLTYLEDHVNEAREKNQPAGLIPAPPEAPVPPRNLWAIYGISAAGGFALLAILFWQRRRLARHGRAIAYWTFQILGWSWVLIAVLWKHLGPAAEAGGWAYMISGILLTDIFRREVRRRRWLTLSDGPMFLRLLLAVVLLGGLQLLLMAGGLAALRSLHLTDAEPLSDFASNWLGCSFFIGVWVILYVTLTAPRRHREAQVQLQLALREAELRALEAQINPHFLFNCLNSIRALVSENPARSQDMLTRLANILRYNLRHDVEHTVPLSSEVEIVSDYLALESARYEDRLRVNMSIDPNAADVQVPPMLLQSLVENALKHGIAPLPEGGNLLIRAAVAGDSMLMEVENPGRIPENPAESTQLGIANVRERLRLLYNGRASFDLKNRNGRVAATVLLPCTV